MSTENATPPAADCPDCPKVEMKVDPKLPANHQAWIASHAKVLAEAAEKAKAAQEAQKAAQELALVAEAAQASAAADKTTI